jgi:hypothetical protein
VSSSQFLIAVGFILAVAVFLVLGLWKPWQENPFPPNSKAILVGMTLLAMVFATGLMFLWSKVRPVRDEDR